METVKFILDRVNLGFTGRADAHNLVVAETDEEILNQVQEAAIQARTLIHMWTYMQLIGWLFNGRIQYFKAMFNWIPNQIVLDLKHLLGDDTNTEERMAILWEWRKLMLYQGALYHCHTWLVSWEKLCAL